MNFFAKKHLSWPATQLVLFLYSLLFLGLSYLLPGVVISVVLIFVYYLTILIVLKIDDLSDYRVLWPGFFVIYSTFYPLQVIVTGFGYSKFENNQELLKDSVNYAFIGLITFIVIVNFLIEMQKNKAYSNLLVKSNCSFYLSEKLLLLIVVPIIVYVLVSILGSGATRKLDIDNVSNTVGYFAAIVVIGLFTLKIGRIKVPFFCNGTSLCFLLLFTIYMLVTGERAIFIRGVLVGLIFFCNSNNLVRWQMVICILIATVVVVPFLQSFKSVLLSGTLNLQQISIELILSNEFISASRNFYSVLLYGVNHSYAFLYNDIIRAVVPKFLIPSLDIASTGLWFHLVYRVEHRFHGTSGWGFGIIAHGYLIDGIFGIILVMSIMAVIVTIIYNNRGRSEYFYLFHISTLLTSIYCIRADMANFLSQVFKIGGMMVLLLMITHKLLLRPTPTITRNII